MGSFAESSVSRQRLKNLRAAAEKARDANYSPYSDFTVLAAIEAGGEAFGGTNVENVNYSLTKHAEEVAVLGAILAGNGPDGNWIETLYVTSASPCGSCRQFVAEFAGPETVVLIDRLDQETVCSAVLGELDDMKIEAWRLGDLLPAAFESGEIDPSSRA